MEAPTQTKDPRRVRAGRLAMLSRWGVPRTARLDELTTDQRRLVLAMIEAVKDLNAAAESPDGGQ